MSAANIHAAYLIKHDYISVVCVISERHNIVIEKYDFFSRRVLPETSCLNYLLPEKWSWYYEQITSSKDISLTDYKNWTIQKNFYTTLFTPLQIMLYNCCYNWCILDCCCCDALQFFCCWTLDYIFLRSVCSMYVLCVSNPAVAAKSNKPLSYYDSVSVCNKWLHKWLLFAWRF